MRKIAAIAREHGVPLIFATDSGQPRRLAAGLALRARRALRAPRAIGVREQIARGELAAADSALATLAADYPDDAMVMWLAGRLAMARGQWPLSARAAFDAARDGDPMPWRARSLALQRAPASSSRARATRGSPTSTPNSGASPTTGWSDFRWWRTTAIRCCSAARCSRASS